LPVKHLNPSEEDPVILDAEALIHHRRLDKASRSIAIVKTQRVDAVDVNVFAIAQCNANASIGQCIVPFVKSNWERMRCFNNGIEW
jgi:hypothetical protein